MRKRGFPGDLILKVLMRWSHEATDVSNCPHMDMVWGRCVCMNKDVNFGRC